MNVTTAPAGQFGWEGQTLHYVVKADGAKELLGPSDTIEGMEVRITGTRQVGDGVEAQVEVHVSKPVFY
jgi:hypothetical protein